MLKFLFMLAVARLVERLLRKARSSHRIEYVSASNLKANAVTGQWLIRGDGPFCIFPPAVMTTEGRQMWR